jgi:hypothetical protein
VLADAVLHSTLPEDEVDPREGRHPARDRDDPRRPGQPPLGVASSPRRSGSIPTASRSSATRTCSRPRTRGRPRRYYRERYVPNNMVVVIAGDVGTTEARAAVERHFGAAPRSRLAPVLVPAEPLQLGPRACTASRRSRSPGRRSRGRSPASPIPRRPSSTSWPWCSAAARARSSGRRSARSEARPHDRRLELEPRLERPLLHLLHLRRRQAAEGRGRHPAGPLVPRGPAPSRRPRSGRPTASRSSPRSTPARR